MFASILVATFALTFVIQAVRAPSRWPRLRTRILGNRPWFYRQFIASWWVLAAAAAIAVAGDDRLTAANVGWSWPGTGYAGIEPKTPVAVLTWIFTGYLLVMLVIGGTKARRHILAGKPVPGRDAVEILLPSTPGERRLATGMAITAGVAEEFVFRGLLIAGGVELYHLPVVAAATISLAIFAAGHVYQGKRGVLGSAIVGLVVTLLYLASGSIIPGIIAHAAQDLIALLLVPPAAKGQPSANSASDSANPNGTSENSANPNGAGQNSANPNGANGAADEDRAASAAPVLAAGVVPEQPYPPHGEARDPAPAAAGQDPNPAARITLRAPTPQA